MNQHRARDLGRDIATQVNPNANRAIKEVISYNFFLYVNII